MDMEKTSMVISMPLMSLECKRGEKERTGDVIIGSDPA